MAGQRRTERMLLNDRSSTIKQQRRPVAAEQRRTLASTHARRRSAFHVSVSAPECGRASILPRPRAQQSPCIALQTVPWPTRQKGPLTLRLRAYLECLRLSRALTCTTVRAPRTRQAHRVCCVPGFGARPPPTPRPDRRLSAAMAAARRWRRRWPSNTPGWLLPGP